ncbi:unnamed protein product [Fusarium graminearum]|nr:unnamed protein product [Fusarium graminearum]CAG1995427.1 unnamed protein product [Fusarium graminearum]VTO82752.1 unnamed protein product [Fusarium graminearum]
MGCDRQEKEGNNYTFFEEGNAGHDGLTKTNDTHLKGPYPSDPDLEFALNASNVLELNALPPASASGFAPEEEKLLGHANSVGTHLVASDIAAQTGKCQTANDSLVGLTSTVAPSVVVVETTYNRSAFVTSKQVHADLTHPAVNISIKWASVVPGSSLRLSPEKMPDCCCKASAAARFTAIMSS